MTTPIENDPLKDCVFQQALNRLGIGDFRSCIFNSNSRGELFHLQDYMDIDRHFRNPTWFRAWFLAVVKEAELTWQRPESIFQHIPRCLMRDIERAKNNPISA